MTRRVPQSAAGLSIRRSLLLGFAAMAAVMILATLVALFSSNQISKSMDIIIEQRLPTMMHTLRVANAVDALAASGISLQSVSSESDRQHAAQKLNNAITEFEQSLSGIDSMAAEMRDVRRFAAALTENLHSLHTMAEQRIAMLQERQFARERLFSNLQTFKQHLTYRVRIIEADNDLINHLLSRPSPPMERIVAMARSSAQWNPVQRFYREVETISRHTLSATQDPTLSALGVSRQTLSIALLEADITFKKLPAEIHSKLDRSFTELQEIVLAESGLLTFRKRELLLAIDSQNLISENHRLTHLIDQAASALMNQEVSETNNAGMTTEQIQQKYMFILLLVTCIGLLGIAALMYFHIIRNVILRLSWLSESMLSIAAGRLDTPLPPSGNDELGRLGVAIRQFQKTAVNAELREADLRLSKQKAEFFYSDLKQKSQELEIMNSKLEKLSITDFLTGLANRRHFDESLATEWTRAMRTGQPLALIMIDVDHFKNFNDRYGHQAGDECLKKVAGALTANACRAGDLVARYGGEEFSIISAETDLAGARELAEKLRRAVQAMSLVNEGSTLGIVTISLGIAVCIPDRKNTASDLVCVADKALYQAKTSGRNRSKGFAELQQRETVKINNM
ncbi:diguanylate cyclase [Psychromonas sp.]|uniref:diguanylate cyclase n=1 Tax=Psychromonas sp. TaxID=1884585 RepID=UPI003566F91F